MDLFVKRFDIFRYLEKIKKYWFIIFILSISIGALNGYKTYTSFVPIYQTSTTLLMHYNRGEGATVSSDFSVGSGVITTLNAMLSSNSMRTQIQEQVGSANLGSISLSQSDGILMTLTVSHTDPNLAADVANVTANVLLEMVSDMMKDINLSLLDPAPTPSIIGQMNLSKSIVIGMIAGIILGVGFALLLEFLDMTIRSPKEVEDILEIPVIAIIPDTEVELTKYRKEQMKRRKS